MILENHIFKDQSDDGSWDEYEVNNNNNKEYVHEVDLPRTIVDRVKLIKSINRLKGLNFD